MPRKTALSIVDPAATGIAPLRNLGQHGRSLWDAVQAEFAIQDRCGIELLMQACEELDMIEGLTADIERDGRVVRTRAGPKAHSALREIRQGRAVLAKLLKELGLSTESLKSMGRPVQPIGWTGDDD